MVEQGLHQQRNAACLEHVLGDIFAAGLEIGDIGRAVENLADVEEIEFDAAFMRDRRQVQRGIGRTAGGGDDRRGILQSLAGDDIARTDVAGDAVP